MGHGRTLCRVSLRVQYAIVEHDQGKHNGDTVYLRPCMYSLLLCCFILMVSNCTARNICIIRLTVNKVCVHFFEGQGQGKGNDLQK